MKKKPCKRVVLKLSGESLQGRKTHGIDLRVFNSLAHQIKKVKKLGIDIEIVSDTQVEIDRSLDSSKFRSETGFCIRPPGIFYHECVLHIHRESRVSWLAQGSARLFPARREKTVAPWNPILPKAQCLFPDRLPHKFGSGY